MCGLRLPEALRNTDSPVAASSLLDEGLHGVEALGLCSYEGHEEAQRSGTHLHLMHCTHSMPAQHFCVIWAGGATSQLTLHACHCHQVQWIAVYCQYNPLSSPCLQDNGW